MYGAEGMEHDEANVKKNGCTTSVNGDAEAHLKVNPVGKSAEASAIRFLSSQEYLSLDTVLNKEDGTWTDISRSSDRSTIISETMPYLVTNVYPRPNLPQSNQAPLLQVDQDCISSDRLSEAAHTATVLGHLPSDNLPVEKVCLQKLFDSVCNESSISEDFENHNDLRSDILEQHITSIKRRKDNLPDFIEYGSEGNACRELSLTDVSSCHPDRYENSALTEISGDTFSMKIATNCEKASQPYQIEGPSIQATVAEKVMVGITLNPTSSSSEVVKQHMIDSMPLLTECGYDENSETAFQKLIQTNSEKVNCPIHENISACTFSSAISIEINHKALSSNFKGELSLPPSPITGVIDSFVGKPNRQNNHLNSLNVEDIAFSFQLPNKIISKEISNNEIGFEMQGLLGRVAESHDCSQILREHPMNVVSLGIHGDTVTQEKESRATFSCSSTSEDDSPSKRRKNEAHDLGPVPRERSLTCHSRKKLLVLDLNGLLCDIVNNYNTSHRGEKRVGGKPIFKRPFCDDFLKFCFDKFDIGIWSSRRKYNVDSALDYLMGEFKHKLLFCWDQSKCTHTGVRTIENHYKPLVLKELKKLWDKEESDLPWEKGEFSPANTLLLDDSPYKALCNPPHTAIFPHPYQHNDEGDKSLGPGGEIRVYLEQLLITDDVQRYVEEHPFGQPAITSSDQHWNFYCDIIKSHAIP